MHRTRQKRFEWFSTVQPSTVDPLLIISFFLDNLVGVLTRFRFDKIVVIGYVEQIFHCNACGSSGPAIFTLLVVTKR